MYLYKYQLRQLDSIMYSDSWTVNDSFILSTVTIKMSSDPKKVFLRELKKLGFTCRRGFYVVVNDGILITLEERKSHKPIFSFELLEEYKIKDGVKKWAYLL